MTVKTIRQYRCDVLHVICIVRYSREGGMNHELMTVLVVRFTYGVDHLSGESLKELFGVVWRGSSDRFLKVGYDLCVSQTDIFRMRE